MDMDNFRFHKYSFNAVYFSLSSLILKKKTWHTATNSLVFINSYKMKMSVILGFMQMTFGLVLSAVNHYHFKREISIWTEFLPQIIFMSSLFGYLCFMIIYKWIYITANDVAPDILKTLIYMFLTPMSLSEPQLFRGQVKQDNWNG